MTIYSFPVGIIACHLANDSTVLLAEIRVEHAQHSRGIDEIAVVKMVVVERVTVVRAIEADQCTPAVVARKVPAQFARGVGVPINQVLLEPLLGEAERSRVAHLQRKSHVVHHLRQAFAAPVRITAKRAACSIIGVERLHPVSRKTFRPLQRLREERQNAVHRVVEREVVALQHFHRAARREVLAGKCRSIRTAVHCHTVAIYMVREKSNHRRCSGRCGLQAYIFCQDAERRTERSLGCVIRIVDTRATRHTLSVLRYLLCIYSLREQTYCCPLPSAGYGLRHGISAC